MVSSEQHSLPLYHTRYSCIAQYVIYGLGRRCTLDGYIEYMGYCPITGGLDAGYPDLSCS
jgi:hypothetical protein